MCGWKQDRMCKRIIMLGWRNTQWDNAIFIWRPVNWNYLDQQKEWIEMPKSKVMKHVDGRRYNNEGYKIWIIEEKWHKCLNEKKLKKKIGD